MLNLAWVKTFLVLLECKSFQAAAQRLQLAQPTVTQHIQKLEQRLGVELLQRARSGCEPTAAARAFLPYAQNLVRLHDRALAHVRDAPLRIGASSNIGTYLLQPYLRAYSQRDRSANWTLTIDRNPVIRAQLEAGELDLALTEWWIPHERWQAQVWKREQVVLIVAPQHPLASRGAITRAELAALPLLGGEPGTGTGRLLAAYLGADLAQLKVDRQLGSTEAVKRAVRAGLGVSIVLASAVVDETRAGELCAIPLCDPPLHKELFLIARAPSPSARESAFIETLSTPLQA